MIFDSMNDYFYLTTAAPEMLRALEAVMGDSEESNYMNQAQIYWLCRSAIRKAKGETS